MATLLQLLTLAFLLLPAATASTLPPSPSSDQTPRPLLHFGPILALLNFRTLATAAPSLSNSTAYSGPVTVFAPSDSSLLPSCPSCSFPLILQQHTVPGLFPLNYLRSLPFATKIETLAPSRCLTITSSSSAPNATKVFVSGAEITLPDLYNDGMIVVHGLQGFVSHLSPLSCNIERATSLSFLPPQDASFVMRLMLKDAMVRLRLSGYSIVAVALRVKYPDLVDLKSVTVFALSDASIFSGDGGYEYVTSFRFHVVPDRLLMASDLERLPAGTVLPTLNRGQDLVVTTGGGVGGLFGGGSVRINYVSVERPDLIFNLKMVIHGLSMPFPHVNVTAVIWSGQVGRSGIDGAEPGGNAEEVRNLVPQPSMIKWTDEMEDHHGL